jgi:low affinity Fe/Cu permease
VYGEHKGHDCVLAAEAVEEQHQAIEEYVNTLQNKLDELQRAYRKIEDTTVAIKAKEIETVHAVREHFEEIMAAVLRRKQTLITQAKLMSAQKIRQLSQQKA